MLWLVNQNTKDSTWLIRIHTIWSDSADACTCSGYLYSPLSCSPPSYVLQVLRWINFPHTRLALNELQASYYSHHRSQSALSETNWPLRVSGCNLTLNPYQIVQMGHHHRHPLTGAMELRPDHWSTTLKPHLETPRDYVLTTYQHI